MSDGLRDIRGPVYFPADYSFLIIIAAITFLIALVFLTAYFLKKRNKKSEVFSPPPKPAHQIAYEALEALKAKALPQSGKVKEYYSELSDIVRHYLEDRFDISAPEMTTEEFLYSLRGSGDLAGGHKNLLKQFLNHCDLVKFAKYGPNQNEIEDSFISAKKLVDETRSQDEL